MHVLRLLVVLAILPTLGGCVLTDLDWLGSSSESRPVREPIESPRTLPPLVQAEVTPSPISGGTLLVSQRDDVAVVADPDTDQVHLVSLAPGAAATLATLALNPGDEPGRVIETDAHYYVALRGGGAVVQLDRELGLVARHGVCASPRGLAAADGSIYVACLGGQLVTFDASTGGELDRQYLGADLRDVVVTEEYVYVSHFRSADVTVISRDGVTAPEVVEIEPVIGRRLEPSIAYRMVEDRGRAVVLHQLARVSDPIFTGVGGSTGGYGGGADCAPALVQAGLTVLQGPVVVNTTELGNLVLPVDVAVDGATGGVMVAAAGQRTDELTLPTRRAPAVARSNIDALETRPAFNLGCEDGIAYTDGRRATAVGHTSDGRGVILTRAPTAVHVVDTSELIALPGPEVFDAGHDLFFGDAGAGIACASCHAEGGEDGLVWPFAFEGDRRTQDIRGGLLGTEPFHWDGSMSDFEHLAGEVFSSRMAGPALTAEHASALALYIDALDHPPHGQDLDPLAVTRGRAIFESVDAQCASCHNGPRLTGPGSFDVGTGGAFQVPSLLGVGLRAPYIHDGCAETLEARFSPECGGEQHGRTDHLAPEELEDLIAYLQSV